MRREYYIIKYLDSQNRRWFQHAEEFQTFALAKQKVNELSIYPYRIYHIISELKETDVEITI